MPKYLVSFSESPFEEQEFKIVNASNLAFALLTHQYFEFRAERIQRPLTPSAA
jgi:hypothetical protein